MPSLDINLLPIVRRAGQDQTSLPGLYAVHPPRRSARGRSMDQLIIYLALSGSAPSEEALLSRLLTHAAHRYFDTPGTITSAQRAAIESINQQLLERNLRGSSGARQGIGLLILAVVREGRVSLAQSGPVRAYLLDSQGVQEFSDPEGAGRGLGLSRALSVRFFQAELHAGDYLLLCPQPAWEMAQLQGVYSQGLESMRRRLLGQAGGDAHAVLIQAAPGAGKMRVMWPKSPAAPRPPAEVQISSSERSVSPEVVPPSDAESAPAEAAPPPEAITPGAAQTPAAAGRWINQNPSPRPIRPRNVSALPTFNGTPVRMALAAVVRRSLAVLALAGRFVKRVLPDESTLNLSPGTMIFLAVAIPLVVSIVGVWVYLDRGRSQQSLVYYQQGYQVAAQAQAQTDPVLQRAAWQQTIQLIATAQAFKTNPEAEALQAQAVQALDQLDRVKRLEFGPALVDPLAKTVNVTQMVATNDELYLLNGAQGAVKRTVLTNQGYKNDTDFRCGPGAYGSTRLVGPLVDIVALPQGSEFNATLLGVDKLGNLLYCIPHETPKAIALATPVVTGWGEIKAIALDQDTRNLYVLDAATRKVWIYQAMAISEQPIQFFDETLDTLPALETMVDMTANRTNLYMLSNDGRMAVCLFGRLDGVQSRCQDPVTYLDDRPGRENAVQMPETQFISVFYAPPPDPSIFLLDARHHAIYQFGLMQLNFYYQYRAARAASEKTATAFAISPERVAFLALGNEVFSARLLP